MMLKAIDLINSGLRVNLGANWLQEILATMRYLVLPVVGLLFLLQVDHSDSRQVAARVVARGLGQRTRARSWDRRAPSSPPDCC